MVRSKKDLEVQLSKLKNFAEPSLELEQYATPDTIAADWIWQMALNGEVAGRTFLDAASGPGILGIALLLMGAKKVYFVDKDESAMKICMNNYNQIKEEYEIGEAEFIIEDISLFDQEVDITVQNPPFGTKTEHADKKFLEKAFEVSKIVYSMHKYSTKSFVEAIAKDFDFEITHFWRYDFPIKATFMHHKKPVKMVDVGLWRMEKK
ncbi:methyltransferase [Candidatus Woesearchaeota archaeon]|jgi:putative methylase|nr:methyltransferase [Candidatus Woesearchaeota archaeon]MBT4111395.1 methyltransferase [Candidatus Woesearchaeota archaeon]MBT4336419.1 methyltransferase [Candidatus Woesearchaeota archaeon]MBT4469926.1 methyltransferase [Candidatus Woesearchaeota archaeon]MBT6744350.1 methyltransferase [Candidatus Woesearchaeota archaeon]